MRAKFWHLSNFDILSFILSLSFPPFISNFNISIKEMHQILILESKLELNESKILAQSKLCFSKVRNWHLNVSFTPFKLKCITKEIRVNFKFRKQIKANWELNPVNLKNRMFWYQANISLPDYPFRSSWLLDRPQYTTE